MTAFEAWDGLSDAGLSIVCETCESELDFADDFTDLGVCRQCGLAFLVDTVSPAGSRDLGRKTG